MLFAEDIQATLTPKLMVSREYRAKYSPVQSRKWMCGSRMPLHTQYVAGALILITASPVSVTRTLPPLKSASEYAG